MSEDPLGKGRRLDDMTAEELDALGRALARQTDALSILKERWPEADGDLDIGGGTLLYQFTMGIYEEGWRAGNAPTPAERD